MTSIAATIPNITVPSQRASLATGTRDQRPTLTAVPATPTGPTPPSPEAAKLLCTERAPPARLPSEKAAKAEIGAMLPGIRDEMVAGGNSPNAANCDIAAGKTLAKLKAKGYDARLVSTGAHVTVRVRTQGKDLIVDPTARQFFKDGSKVDAKLDQRGGFVGSESELRALVRDNHQALESDKFQLPSEAGLRKQMAGAGVSDAELNTHVKDVLVPELVDQVADRFFSDAGGAALKQEARRECMRTLLKG